MAKYVLKRILWMIPVMLGVVVIVFTISHFTPGDPVQNIVGLTATPEQYARKAAELGLDKGYFGQLFSYIWGIITKFDFGKSYLSNLKIADELVKRFSITARLGLSSVAVSVLLGLPLGILSAIRQYKPIDFICTISALIFAAIPGFVLSLISMLFFGVKLQWLPIGGIDGFKSWILPVLTSALPGVALIFRQTRANMLEVIRQDYIRTARAKGLSERVIRRKHALNNCMIPIVTVIGGTVAFVLAGALITENVFNIRGLGSYLYTGILSRDYPIINGCVLLIAFIVCICNLLVDVSYTFIDPRIHAQYTSGKKTKKSAKPDKEESVAA